MKDAGCRVEGCRVKGVECRVWGVNADHDAVGGLEAAELEQQLCEPAARNQKGVRLRGS